MDLFQLAVQSLWIDDENFQYFVEKSRSQINAIINNVTTTNKKTRLSIYLFTYEGFSVSTISRNIY